MLVRDINGNGSIDSGREMFGDQTRLPNDQLAANGFAALSVLDKDANGVADGVIDANELQSLADAGITSIKLAPDASGNISSFTQNGAAHTVQNVNLQGNTFVREFINKPAITASAALPPQMQGAGLVRDLRWAMRCSNRRDHSRHRGSCDRYAISLRLSSESHRKDALPIESPYETPRVR